MQRSCWKYIIDLLSSFCRQKSVCNYTIQLVRASEMRKYYKNTKESVSGSRVGRIKSIEVCCFDFIRDSSQPSRAIILPLFFSPILSRKLSTKTPSLTQLTLLSQCLVPFDLGLLVLLTNHSFSTVTNSNCTRCVRIHKT